MEKERTDSGSKAYQRDDEENREAEYMDWHRTLDSSLYMTDVDSIEWEYDENGKLNAVAVIEVTRVDKGKEVNEAYKQKIIDRYVERDMQRKATIKVADALDTNAYIVLFREGCSEFWGYNLTKHPDTEWKKIASSSEEMEENFQKLRR